jgi:hypothetical protein
MKVVSFLFIAYLFFLLTQPCQDMAARVVDCSASAVAVTHIDRSDDTQRGSDDCSPFCFCSCCGLSVTHHYSTADFLTTIAVRSNRAVSRDYQNPYLNSFQDSIWQPPKSLIK